MKKKTELDEREKVVMKYISEGLNARQIAEIMCVPMATVHGIRQRVRERLQCHSQAQIVAVAVYSGLLKKEGEAKEEEAEDVATATASD